MFSKSRHQLIMCDSFATHPRLYWDSITQDKHRLANHRSFDSFRAVEDDVKESIDGKQRGGSNQPANQRIIVVHHGVLNGIPQNHDQHQIEDVHLAKFTFAQQSKPEYQEDVNDNRLPRYNQRASKSRVIEDLLKPFGHAFAPFDELGDFTFEQATR